MEFTLEISLDTPIRRSFLETTDEEGNMILGPGNVDVIRLVAVEDDFENRRLMLRFVGGRMVQGIFESAKKFRKAEVTITDEATGTSRVRTEKKLVRDDKGVVWHARGYHAAGFVEHHPVTEAALLDATAKQFRWAGTVRDRFGR